MTLSCYFYATYGYIFVSSCYNLTIFQDYNFIHLYTLLTRKTNSSCSEIYVFNQRGGCTKYISTGVQSINPLFQIIKKRESSKSQSGNYFVGGDFSQEVAGTLPQNRFPGPMRSYIVKENNICSAVSEILRYTQTQTIQSLLFYEDSELANFW